MPYDLYPAVDENYNFPTEVRAALAKSVELRSLVIPMTTTQRNNLTAAEKWDGRIILNTDTERLQRYDADDGSWAVVAEESDAVIPLTTTQRNNLSPALVFNGRLILNTTVNRIQRYDAATTTWISIIEPADLTQLLSTTGLPAPVGATSAAATRGTSSKAAREDHVHAPAAALIYASGSYAGDAATTLRTISLPFTPKFVQIHNITPLFVHTVFDSAGAGNYYMSPGSGGTIANVPSPDGLLMPIIVANGFQVKDSGDYRTLNKTGQTYKYWALG